jgi:TfoX/Sxy family transcriptional regulator of competence genes
MASDLSYVEYVCDQAGLNARLTYRKMFGEFALYLDGKVVALVCDNQLFVKPTTSGRELLGSVPEESPYPGAKPHLLVAVEIDDPDLLRRLLIATAQALPLPKPKRAKQSARPK